MQPGIQRIASLRFGSLLDEVVTAQMTNLRREREANDEEKHAKLWNYCVCFAQLNKPS
jgi:hypothetical protein